MAISHEDLMSSYLPVVLVYLGISAWTSTVLPLQCPNHFYHEHQVQYHPHCRQNSEVVDNANYKIEGCTADLKVWMATNKLKFSEDKEELTDWLLSELRYQVFLSETSHILPVQW